MSESTPAPRRRRWPLWVALGLVVALVAAAAAVIGPRALGKYHRERAQNAAQTTPKGVDATTLGYVVARGEAASGAPLVVVYEDFQCVLCQQADDLYLETWLALADRGNIRLQFVDMALLDAKLHNDGSTRAAIAAGCAATVDAYLPYRSALFASQAAPGRKPWTDDALKGAVAQAAGLTGQTLATFQTCYDNRATRDFVAKATSTAVAHKITGAPVITVNGATPQVPIEGDTNHNETDWWKQLPAEQGAWMAAISQAAGS